MSTYILPNGDETVVCDTCGVDYTGSKPDLTHATKFDFTAEMLKSGFPQGASLSVTDTCPECTKREVRR